MSGTVITRPVSPRPAVWQAKEGIRVGWLEWLAAMLRAIETRHRLAEMDERMLHDIGITRGDAIEEATRAPWDLGPKAHNAPWLMR
jgi:uncharacterized protein YjiS (DUF1127 family)